MSERIKATQRHLTSNDFSGLDHMDTAGAASESTGGNSRASIAQAKKYPLTQYNTGLLTEEQQQFYEDNGYLVIRKLFPLQDMDIYAKRFTDLANGVVPPSGPTMTIMKDVSIAKRKDLTGEQTVTKIQDWQDDEVLFGYCQHPAIVPYVQCFTGPNVKSVHTMLIAKPPNTGETGRHPLHQDQMYFPFRPSDRIVCSWTSMESVNRENGCLVVIPGTHKGKLLEHGIPDWSTGVNKAYWGIKSYDANVPLTHLAMEPGDTVFFHPILIHGSGWNKTQGYRKSISCHYASTDCYHIDVAGTIQEPMGQEIVSMIEKKLVGADVSFNDLWRAKSRLISGHEGTL